MSDLAARGGAAAPFFLRGVRSALFACAALSPAAGAASEVGFRVDSYSLSEPVSLTAIIGDWDDTFHGGNTAFTANLAELYLRQRAWFFAVASRYDYWLTFTEDTAEAAYLDQHHRPLRDGHRYAVRLKANELRATGLKLGYAFELGNGLRLEPTLAYWRASDFMDGTLRGYMRRTGDEVQAELALGYAYTEDVLLDREVDPGRGHGWSLDLALDWRLSEVWRVQLKAKDLLSRIYWPDAPYTRASGDTVNQQTDADGSLQYAALINGVEGYADHQQRLPWRVELMVSAVTGSGLGGLAQLFASEAWVAPRLGVSFGGWHTLYDFGSRAVELGYSGPYGRIALLADERDPERAHTLRVQLEGRIPW